MLLPSPKNDHHRARVGRRCVGPDPAWELGPHQLASLDPLCRLQKKNLGPCDFLPTQQPTSKKHPSSRVGDAETLHVAGHPRDLCLINAYAAAVLSSVSPTRGAHKPVCLSGGRPFAFCPGWRRPWSNCLMGGANSLEGRDRYFAASCGTAWRRMIDRCCSAASTKPTICLPLCYFPCAIG